MGQSLAPDPGLFSVPLDPDSPDPLHRQLADGLRQAVLDGRLQPGARLPASRALAGDLGVSRGTVVHAYEHLEAEGVVRSRVGAGTFVDDVRSDYVAPGRRAQAVSAPVWQSALRPLHTGASALDAFPRDVFARLSARAYRRLPQSAFGYGDPAGYRPLRKALADHLGAARGVRCVPEQVVVTTGAQQAMRLVAQAIGADVWTEDPGYAGARAAVAEAGLMAVPVAMDREGLQIEDGLARAPHARLAVVTPAHHFPLGVTMSLRRRMDLIAWAQQSDAWVLEDDYDGEYRYAGRPLATLHSLDATRVFYAGTFSKTLSPALRLGYLVVPPSWIDRVVALRDAADRGGPTVPQAVLAEFIAGGHLGRHVRRTRALCRRRQEALVDAAREHLGGVLRLDPSDAGLHLVGHLMDGRGDAEAARRAEEAGVRVTALSAYAVEAPLPPGLVLGYASYPEAVIRDAVAVLGRALR